MLCFFIPEIMLVQLKYMHLHRIKGQLVLLTKSQDLHKIIKHHPAHFLTLVMSLELAIYKSYFFNSHHMKLYKMQPVSHNVYYQVKVCEILQSFENSWVDRWQGDHLQLSAEWVCIRVLITLIFILNDEG